MDFYVYQSLQLVKTANIFLQKLEASFPFEFFQVRLTLSGNITLITHHDAKGDDFYSYFKHLGEGRSIKKQEIIEVSGDVSQSYFIISNISYTNTEDNIAREII